MCLQTNVVRRAGSARYYARIAVPNDLQSVVGKRELWKSLGTADPREARSRAAPLLALWHGEFDELRRKRAPSEDDLQAAVWRHYQRELESDRRDRASVPQAAARDAAKVAYEDDLRTGKAAAHDLGRAVDYLVVRDAAALSKGTRQRRERALRQHLATGEIEPIQWAVDEVIAREGLIIEKGSTAYHDLAQRLQRAELEALQRAAEHDRGDWSGKPGDELVKPPKAGASATPVAKSGETIMDHYDRFAREKAGSASTDTWTQNRKLVQRFAEFVGETAHITSVNRKAVRDWKHALEKWPRKAAELREFKGKKFAAVIAANVGLGKPVIDPKTINKYLAAVGAFGRWLLANDYIDSDIMRGMYLDVDKSKRTRLPFTSDQLSTLFASPLFTGFQTDGKEHQPGNVRADDWRYWIPLVALFTGARLGEIAQLHVADVRDLHGHPIFHFAEGGDKKLKNAGSARVVPVHPELVRLGFLDYRDRMKAAKSKRLFPDIVADARGFVSGVPSTFFNHYFERIGTKTDKSVNVHSFRHGFADALRRAGFRDEEFGFLLGHVKASTTGKYGIIPEGVLSQRVAMIAAVNFPGLDLTPLHAHS